jgi:hypothetical protein
VLQSQLQVYRERGFSVQVIHADLASAFMALRTQFPGVLFEAGGAKDYIAKIDSKMWRVKETYRSVKAGLAWKLPLVHVEDLTAFCVSRLNLRQMSALNGVVRPSFHKVFGLAFGDYVEVYDGMTSTSRARSLPCITLYPVGNSTGSWVFLSLTTRRYLRRSNWIKMVTTDLVVGVVNAMEDQEVMIADEPKGLQVVDEDPVPLLLPDADEASEGEVEEEDEEVSVAELPAALRRSARIEAGVAPPDKLTLVTKIKESTWTTNEDVGNAVKAELKQLFHEELNALKPGQVALELHMFVTEKFTSAGECNKTKARLVADGPGQDARLYPKKSSPTLVMQSLYTVLTLYAGMTAR